MKYKIIKLLTCIIYIICLIICWCSCEKNNICIKKESFFSNFEVQDGKVYVYCTLYIDNSTGLEKDVNLYALLEDDVKNGLLKKALINGYSIDEYTKCFHLQKGENQFEVVFIGEHAGQYKKHDRTLPNIKIIEIN